MNKKYDGNTPLAVGLVLLIAFAGTVYFNCVAGRASLQPETMMKVVEESNIKEQFLERADYLYENNSDVLEEVKELVYTDEFDQLVEDYATYISEYILEGNDSNQIGRDDFYEMLYPVLRNHYGDSADEATLAEQTDRVLDEMNLDSVFRPAEEYLPDGTLSMIQILLSSTVRNVSLILTVVLVLLLLVTAMPRRFLTFFGAAAIVTGGLTIAASRIVDMIFDALSSNRLMVYMLEDYTDRAGSLGLTIIITGVISLVIGIIILLICNSRTSR